MESFAEITGSALFRTVFPTLVGTATFIEFVTALAETATFTRIATGAFKNRTIEIATSTATARNVFRFVIVVFVRLAHIAECFGGRGAVSSFIEIANVAFGIFAGTALLRFRAQLFGDAEVCLTAQWVNSEELNHHLVATAEGAAATLAKCKTLRCPILQCP